eukprot:6876302-Prymnesium_polylepis.1
MSDTVDGRSAARCRSTIVRQNDTIFSSDLSHLALRRVASAPLVRGPSSASVTKKSGDRGASATSKVENLHIVYHAPTAASARAQAPARTHMSLTKADARRLIHSRLNLPARLQTDYDRDYDKPVPGQPYAHREPR